MAEGGFHTPALFIKDSDNELPKTSDRSKSTTRVATPMLFSMEEAPGGGGDSTGD
jgi:hypothetical protein